MKRLLYIILFIIYTFFKANSQTPYYIIYTENEGLPSNEVYCIFQDSKGYVWFGTDAGVARFNGYTFELFNTSNGLTDNTVFHIVEDNQKNIWFGTYNCNLSYYSYQKDSILPYKYNHVIQDSLKGTKLLSSLYIDSNEVVMGFYRKYGIVSISNNGNLKFFKTDNELDILMYKNCFGFIGVVNKIMQKYSFNLYDFSNNLKIKFNSENNYNKGLKKVIKTKDKYVFFYKNELFEIGFDGVVSKQISGIENAINLYKKDDAYYLLNQNAIYKFFNNKIDTLDFIKDVPSNMLIDKNDRIWISTLNNGIYLSPQFNISFYDIKNKFLKNDFKNNRIIYLDEDVYYIRNNDLFSIKKGFVLNDIIGIYNTSRQNEVFLINSNFDGFYYNIKNYKKYELDFKNKYNSKVKCFYDNDSMIVVGSFNGINIFEKLKNTKNFLTSTVKKVIIYNDEIYFSNIDGLFKISRSSGHIEAVIPNISVTSIVVWNNKLVVATKFNGVFEGNGISFNNILNDVTNIKKLFASNDSLYILTSNSLFVYNGKKIKYLLSSNLLNATFYDGVVNKSILYLYCNDRIYRVNLNNSKNKDEPTFYLKRIVVDNQSKVYYTKLNSLNFKFNYPKKISLYFDVIDFTKNAPPVFKYRVQGFDTIWYKTTDKTITLNNLEKGDYLIELNLEYTSIEKSKTIRFKILPPFYKTAWFIGLEIILLIVIIYLIIKSRERFIKNKTEKELNVKNKIKELELKALKAQINPHFTFNSLNAIQNLILKKSLKEANNYLTNFAELLRKILQNANDDIVSLSDEIDLIKLYLKIEKNRFENKFDYNIIIDESIDIQYYFIPSMIIQPFIENAIWHGLMNKENKGWIEIKFYLLDDNFIICEVKDNGIGRDKAKQLKKDRKIDNKSLGISITKDRLNLLNKSIDNIEFIDLFDEKKMPSGTIVKIKIKYYNA